VTATRTGALPRLTVMANCPNCGAPIDFGEGTNAFQCDHCRSQLLVTGHGRVLSYFVAPKIEAARAISAARFAQDSARGPLRTGEARLFFLPYYRLTATDVRWQRPEPEPPEPPPEPGEGESGTSTPLGVLLRQLVPDRDPEEIECRDRAIERNFVAVDLPGLSLYSLGMRPNALRLELYRREALDALGHVVGIEMSAEAALATGRKTGDGMDVACRAVVGAVLSVVHFPFWLVEILRRPRSLSLTIVDAVSQAVIDRDVDAAIVERLGKPASGAPSVVGFRPLVCPNCGWDLPVAPEHVIFYCGSCFRAWRIAGDELVELPHDFAATPDSGSRVAAAEHLPFWSLRAAVGDEAPQSFLAPAFRYRRARSLVELTAALSRVASSLAKGSSRPPRAHGGFFDEADAAALALLAHAGASPRSFTRAERYRHESIRIESAELVWLPFAADAYSLRDALCGMAVTRVLLL
jgi:predicted RNA-binding Zn-ribbon protein involved in translation (DUF1610 family)